MVAAPEGGPLTCRLVLLASFVRTTLRRPFRRQPVGEGAHSKVGSDFCNERAAVYLSSFQGLIDRFPADFSDQCPWITTLTTTWRQLAETSKIANSQPERDRIPRETIEGKVC